MQKNRLVLLGIPFDNLKMDEAIHRIIKMTQKNSKKKKNHFVATANVDFIINAHRGKNPKTSSKLLSILRNADLVTADGMPLVWLSKLLGRPLKERVTGADMVPHLAKAAGENNKSIYLLGGMEGAAKTTVEILKTRHPKLQIAGYESPIIDINNVSDNKALITKINATNPDILFIALGNPKQELWFEKYRHLLEVPVSIGVGGTFEFISGQVSRAPEWIQKSGLEWVYRISQDPGRLISRYATDLFSFMLMTVPLLLIHYASKFIKYLNLLKFIKMPISLNMINRSSSHNGHQIYNASKLGEIDTKKVENKKITIDFCNVSRFSIHEIMQLMTFLLQAKKRNLSTKLINLRRIPYLILWSHRVNDLVKPLHHN